MKWLGNDMVLMSMIIHPFSQVVACLQSGGDLFRIHARIFGAVFRVFPLEELLTILRVRLTSEMAVSSSLLVFRLTQCQSHRNRSWTAIKLHLDDVRNILSCQCPLLSAIRFDKQ